MSNSDSTSTSDFFYKLPKSRQHIISLAILFIIPLILFFDTTLGGKELQRHDITQFRGAVESVVEYRETYGEEPLWASNIYGGMPSFVISIIKEVPHLDRIAGLFKGIYPAFQFWVLFSGMYFFLILVGFRPLSALLGSLMYGLTTYFPVIIIAGHTSKFFALALVPWLISGYWILSRHPKKMYGLLLFTVALAMEIRAGHPQITYYFFYLIGLFWIYDTWNAYKTKQLKSWSVVTAFLLIGTFIGAMGHAERILALQEYAAYSMRGGSALKGTETLDPSYAFGWSQGISETLTLLLPNLFGGSSPDYWGPKTSTSGPHYLGVLTLLLLLISLFKVRKKEMFLFLAAGILGILFAWGSNFGLLNNFAFDFVPFFSKFRAPETWLVLTAFSFTIVSIYGLEWLLDYVQEKSPKLTALYRPLGVIALIIVGLFFYLNSSNFTKEGEVDRIAFQIAQQNQVNPQNPQVVAQARNYVNTRLVPAREEKANSDMLRLFLFTVVGVGLIYLLISNKISIAIGSLGLVLVAAVDLIGVGQRYMPETSFVASNINPINYIESQKRDIDAYIEENIYSEDNSYPYRVFPLLEGPFSTAVPAYFYPTLGGYTAAKLGIIQEAFINNPNPLFSGQFGINLDLLAMLNAKYITYSAGLNIPGLTPAFNGRAGVVYELDNVLPKAFFVDSTITAETAPEAFEYLSPGRIDFAKVAVVENFDATTSLDSLSSVEVTSYTGAEISLKVSRSKPGFLVLSEIYYPAGWVALLDGEEVPIHKTNYLVRGVQIPAGEHTLELDFRPRSYALGVKLSWFSLISQILMAFIAGIIFYRDRTTSED
ncbi:MAG: YfhO family protein [Balneolaceae bacterium]|nr:YfhO family protein [Balneolaceae bacterium]MBO6546054.1 YfhO family protein [Balneolaceae bacterium]MBO6647450.1 YfhO family protein [Balneolaceae bacterium]